MSNRHRTRRAGFTLVETIIAMALMGMVTLGAVTLFEQVLDADLILSRETAVEDVRANSERILRNLVRNAESSTDSTLRFFGDERSMQIATWCPATGGWLERCQVSIRLVGVGDSTSIVVRSSAADPIAVSMRGGMGVLRYLDRSTSSDGEWRPIWGESIVLPSAIGVIVGADTLVLPMGASNG